MTTLPYTYGASLPARTSSLGYTTNEPVYHARTPSINGYSAHGRFSRNPSWKARKTSRKPVDFAKDMSLKRWDGAARKSAEWDGLRRDPELWFPDGNVQVHLYTRGQSRRGASFRVPYEALVATNCRPLLHRFLAESLVGSPVSEISYHEDGYFEQSSRRQYDLYIPAPPTAEREQAFLYHAATRNFFAWIFGKPLVGTHLGGALVGLLNSMYEFRSEGEDHVQAILDYTDMEGYADMRNVPDHALAILFFAEHFQFKDLWIDAFAHCAGMNDILITSVGFEYMTRQTRAFITRSRFEMDMRLDDCGKKLSSFLSEELSESHLNLTTSARAHLDQFRTFLHSFYVAKLGYYPPPPAVSENATFPTSVYRQMRTEFQRLYDLLVDSSFKTVDAISSQGGICVLQNTRSFDKREKYTPLQCPFPLLPQTRDLPLPKPSKRFPWTPKSDKMQPDERLVSIASLTKATNRKDSHLYDCNLVRAYRGFERDCVLAPSKTDKDKLSIAEGRKVRWLLIYSTLQTLIAATEIPEEVRDIRNVPYNLTVLTEGCPPWKEQRPITSLLRSQTEQTKVDYLQSLVESRGENATAIKPDIDYAARIHRPPPLSFKKSDSNISNFGSRRGSVRRAIESLGSMPELQHPSPKHATFHEILVHGYGNGTNTVVHTTPFETMEEKKETSHDLDHSSEAAMSSRWSKSSYGTNADDVSPESSVSSHSRRGSDSSDISEYSVDGKEEQPLSGFGLGKVASSIFSMPQYEPEPLHIQKLKPQDYDYYMTITTDVKVEFEDVGEVKHQKRVTSILG